VSKIVTRPETILPKVRDNVKTKNPEMIILPLSFVYNYGKYYQPRVTSAQQKEELENAIQKWI